MRQLGFAMNDMAWHTVTEPVTVSVEEFERTATAPAQITPYISGTAMSPAFSHIFGGGYAAGYYGYKWAEVLEADAFSLFEEQGIFNRDVAGSFRENILSKGGSEHPMTLYVRFRGHKPETKRTYRQNIGITITGTAARHIEGPACSRPFDIIAPATRTTAIGQPVSLSPSEIGRHLDGAHGAGCRTK